MLELLGGTGGAAEDEVLCAGTSSELALCMSNRSVNTFRFLLILILFRSGLRLGPDVELDALWGMRLWEVASALDTRVLDGADGDRRTRDCISLR